MRWHAVASVVFTAFVAASIAAFPAARAFGQANGAHTTTPAAAVDGTAAALGQAPAAPPAGSAPPPDGAAADSRVSGPANDTAPLVPSPPPPLPANDGAASAGPAPAVSAAITPPPRLVASLSHDLQFGLAVLLGDGYRGIYPYYDLIDCGDAKSSENRVCTSRAPVFIDLQPSFGLSERWDALVDVRFGLTADFNTYHQFFLMPGFRYWLDPQSQVKFFTTLQFLYDRSPQNSRPGAPHAVSDSDIGFRNSNGLMLEVMRNLGVFVQFGESVGFYRWLSFAVDAGVGIQARVP